MMMRGLRLLPFVVLMACAIAGRDTDSTNATIDQALGAGPGFANIFLTHSQTSLLQTSDTPWTLAKTGAVDPSTQTVTWTITATPSPRSQPILVIDGFVGLTNFG